MFATAIVREKPVMQPRDKRVLRFGLVTATLGAVGFAIIVFVYGASTSFAYVVAAVLGAASCGVFGMLVAGEIDDGQTDQRMQSDRKRRVRRGPGGDAGHRAA